MEFKAQQLNDMFFENDDSVLEYVWSGPWEQDYKYQCKEIVFKYNNRYFKWYLFRLGSPFTNWDYEHRDFPESMIDCEEVEPKQILTLHWEKI